VNPALSVGCQADFDLRFAILQWHQATVTQDGKLRVARTHGEVKVER
jgi:hypothetical protein